MVLSSIRNIDGKGSMSNTQAVHILEQQNHWCTESMIIMGSAWDKVSQEMNTNKEELDV